MSTLYLEARKWELEVADQCIVLREEQKLVERIPLRLVDRVVATGDVTLRASAVRQMAKAGVGLYLAATRTGANALLWPADMRSGWRRLGQAKMRLDANERKRWAGRIVRGKVAGQIAVLRALQERRPHDRFELEKARRTLSGSVLRLRLEEPAIASLLGIEGAASAAYFEGLRVGFAPGLGFTSRNRRPPKDPVNASLSLGYTMLYHASLEGVLSAGLEPSVGLLHEPLPGRAGLACDVMEPFRPSLDWAVWQMWQTRVLRAESFTTQQGACLLGKAGRRQFYGAMEEPLERMRMKIRKVCGSFGRLAEETVRGEQSGDAYADEGESGEELR